MLKISSCDHDFEYSWELTVVNPNAPLVPSSKELLLEDDAEDLKL